MAQLLIFTLLLLLSEQSAEGSDPVKVFLGPIPSPEGFTASAPGFEDSYRDLREELKKNRSFQEVIQLVKDPSEAQIVVEITSRGRVDSGRRIGSVTSTSDTTATATSSAVMVNQLNARLAVVGSTYSLDIDGAAGLRLITYRRQARNVLAQVVDWVRTNRSELGEP